MTLDTVAKFSAAYILTVIVSATGFTLWEGLHPRTIGTTDPSAELLIADR